MVTTASDEPDYGLDIARAAVADGLAHGITELEVVKVVQAETTAKMGDQHLSHGALIAHQLHQLIDSVLLK